jgi:hypothetical protein
MEALAKIEEVRTFETRGGNTRFVIRDDEGREYTTFREAIGERAQQLTGRPARIEYHEEQRGRYRNVYLDKVEPGPATDGDDADASEVGWRTAVEAAPWLVGESEPHEAVSPDELYTKLKPFQERVAEDIREDESEG